MILDAMDVEKSAKVEGGSRWGDTDLSHDFMHSRAKLLPELFQISVINK
jgi:hypothetical protein